MGIKIIISEKANELNEAIIELTKELLRELGNNLVSVEGFNGCDGSNVLIIVRKKSWETIEKVYEAVEKVEERLKKPGLILPEIQEIGED